MDLVNDPDAIEELKSLWQKSPVMVYRRQSLEESELVRFTEHFGRCETSGRKDIQSPYHEQIIYFSTLKYADGRFVGGFAGGDDVDWHSDQTFQVRPATGAHAVRHRSAARRRRHLLGQPVRRLGPPAEGHPAAHRGPHRHLPLCEALRHAQRARAEGQGEGERDAEPAGRAPQGGARRIRAPAASRCMPTPPRWCRSKACRKRRTRA